jgi:hypothetical protein
VKKFLVETYNLIGKIKQYYGFSHRVYKIIYDKFRGTKTNIKISFQITVKTINDSAGPDGIIPILLVFRAYPRITNNSTPFFIVIKRAKTIKKNKVPLRRVQNYRCASNKK